MVHTLHYKQGKRKCDNLNMFCPYFINPFNKLVFIPWGIVANIFISTGFSLFYFLHLQKMHFPSPLIFFVLYKCSLDFYTHNSILCTSYPGQSFLINMLS